MTDKTYLSLENTLKLSAWLRLNNDSLKQQQTTYADAAVLASKALDATIKQSHIISVVNAMGHEMTWRGSQGRGGGKSSGYDRVRVLAKAIVELYSELGVEPPENVRDILYGRGVTRQPQTDDVGSPA